MDEILEITLRVTAVCERLGVAYAVVGEETPRREVVVASASDTIAQKLYWYSLGDRVSERQWSDAIGVLKVTGTGLDLAYLHRVSTMLGVAGLLDEALRTVGR